MFAVFSVTDAVMDKLANKKVREFSKGGSPATDEEKLADYNKAIAAIRKKKTPVILTPELSQPSVAKQLLDMLAEQPGAANLIIKIKVPIQKKNKKGVMTIKKQWVPYIEGKKYKSEAELT